MIKNKMSILVTIIVIMVVPLEGGIKDMVYNTTRNMYQNPLWTAAMAVGVVGVVVCHKNVRYGYKQMLEKLNLDSKVIHPFAIVFKELGQLPNNEVHDIIKHFVINGVMSVVGIVAFTSLGLYGFAKVTGLKK